jgi:hypothetical protein
MPPTLGASGFWLLGKDSPAALSAAKAAGSLSARAEKRVEDPNERTNFRRFMNVYLNDDFSRPDSLIAQG